MKLYLSILISSAFISLYSISTAQSGDAIVSQTISPVTRVEFKKSILKLSYKINGHQVHQLDGRLVSRRPNDQSFEKTKKLLVDNEDLKPVEKKVGRPFPREMGISVECNPLGEAALLCSTQGVNFD